MYPSQYNIQRAAQDSFYQVRACMCDLIRLLDLVQADQWQVSVIIGAPFHAHITYRTIPKYLSPEGFTCNQPNILSEYISRHISTNLQLLTMPSVHIISSFLAAQMLSILGIHSLPLPLVVSMHRHIFTPSLRNTRLSTSWRSTDFQMAAS